MSQKVCESMAAETVFGKLYKLFFSYYLYY